MRAALALLLLLISALAARADQIDIPPALDRTGPIVAIWRPDHPAAGTVRLDWTDTAGRLVEQHQLDLPTALPEAAITLDLRRALVPDNTLTASFLPHDGGPPSHATAEFLARPKQGWDGYQVLLWQIPPPGSGAALRSLGITGAALLHPLAADGQARARQFLADDLRWVRRESGDGFLRRLSPLAGGPARDLVIRPHPRAPSRRTR